MAFHCQRAELDGILGTNCWNLGRDGWAIRKESLEELALMIRHVSPNPSHSMIFSFPLSVIRLGHVSRYGKYFF